MALCSIWSMGQVTPSELAALQDFYNATGGPNWVSENDTVSNNNWDFSGSVTNDWRGITISGNHVVKLELSNNGLKGTIPNSIAYLTSLDILNLSNNQISGSIPDSIGLLYNLRYLILNLNQLIGNIPASMGQMTDLYVFRVDHNLLSGTIPSSLGMLTNLATLLLYNNQLTGSIPKALGNMTQLSSLALDSNQLTGIIPESLGSLTNLRALNLNGNHLSGNIPANFVSLINLNYFDLHQNFLSGPVPDLSDFPDLRRYRITSNRFTFGDFETIYQSQSNFTYSAQAKVNNEENITVAKNALITMTTTVSGSQNHYQWFKDGVAIPGAPDSAIYTILNAQLADSGIYYCKVTSDIVTDLTLVRNNIVLSVVGDGDVTSVNYIKTINPKSELSISELEAVMEGGPTISNLVLEGPVSSGTFTAEQGITLKDGFHATGDVTIKIMLGNGNILKQILYLDGLGRPVQRIAKRQSPDGNDLVQFTNYDQFGREAKHYLPYAANQNTGSYIIDAKNQQTNYYQSKYGDTYSFGETAFDGSPLNRVSETAFPGYDWRIISYNDNDHTQKREYESNTATDEIIKFTIDDTGETPIVTKGSYGVNELLKNVVKNENWQTSDGNFNTMESYSDKNGRTIAKMAYDEGPNGSVIKLVTQNVYDVKDRLRYILPPKALIGVDTSQGTYAVDDELIYQYQYDGYNRQIAQRIPGRDWEHLVYDQLDRPILTQDAILASNNQWFFTKYDVFGRPVYSGIYASTDTRSQLQQAVDDYINGNTDNLANVEKRTSGTATMGDISINYTNNAFPINNIAEILLVNYYDDYAFTDSDKPVAPTTILGQTVTTRTKGLQTANFSKTLGQSTWTKLYSYYDEKAREIKVYNKNHLDGYTTTDSEIDFRGKTELSITKHKRNTAATELVINDRFTYDHAERPLGHFQEINGQTEERITENEYDELGQLIKKRVGGSSSSSNALQELTYEYHINGQLMQLNDVDALGNNLFAYKINYNQVAEGSSPTPARYDGSISQTIWRSAYDDTKRSYAYSYDKLNRLSTSNFQYNDNLNGNTGLDFNTQLSYDDNGNIKTLSRNGTGNIIDQLNYDYGSSGNQLLSVSDAYGSVGFLDGNTSGNDYDFDGNGNLIKDLNKGITQITYNQLDLVKEVSLPNNKSVAFTYDASGQKLNKTYLNGTTTLAATDYLGGFQYQDGALQFFPTPEGYVYRSGNTYKYVYIYGDHLGNNRVSYSDINDNGIVDSGELLSNTDYYPFGNIQAGQFTDGLAAVYKYTFQGKEYQDENGLNWHDFGSRMYDASLGRWMSTDPQNQFGSPYLAMGNNPVSYTDPNGEYTGIDDLIAFAVGGAINTVANWNNIDNLGDGLSYFAVGGVSGMASLYGGPVAGGAVLAFGNSFTTQYRKNGGEVALGQVLGETVIGAATAGIGSKLSPLISSQTSRLFSGANSLFSQYASDAVSNVASGVVLETTVGVVQGQSLNDSFSGSLENIPQSLVISAIGTTGTHYRNKHLAKQEAKKALFEAENKADNEILSIELTTSSKSLKPSRNYTIFDEKGEVYKFGVTDPNLKRYGISLKEAGPNSTGIFSDIKPKYEAHISEKYMRSLYFNSTGKYFLEGMKIPFPVNFDTGLRIKL